MVAIKNRKVKFGLGKLEKGSKRVRWACTCGSKGRWTYHADEALRLWDSHFLSVDHDLSDQSLEST